MSSRRVLKVAQAIREVVSLGILMDIKDPRVANVTVTFVEVSGDLRQAKVHVSVMGDETKQRLCMRGLQSARGFLQKKVGNRIETRYVPQLQFVLDDGVKKSMVVTKILDEVLPDRNSEQSTESPAEPEGAETDSMTGVDAGIETPDQQDESAAHRHPAELSPAEPNLPEPTQTQPPDPNSPGNPPTPPSTNPPSTNPP